MTIKFIKSLPITEALKVHRVVADFAGSASSMAFVSGHGSNIHFGGEIYQDMQAVVQAIEKKVCVPANDIAGFAGKTILSCHFTASAAEAFKAAFPQQDQDNLVHQFVAGSNWVLAVTNWGKIKSQQDANQHLRVEMVGEKFNTYNIIFSNSDLMEEFEDRHSRSLFDHEAQVLIVADARAQSAKRLG